MLEVKNIYKVYDNGTVALQNVSLDFEDTGFVAIVGKSGCGKSTLLNVMSCNDEPSKGDILFDGARIGELNGSTTKYFACIYQDFKLIENLTVYQNIEIGHELACCNINHEYILQVAERLGLANLLDEKVFSLSGGEQQRVAIARAIVTNPKVVFADEPTGNLDSKNTDNVFKILKELSSTSLVVVVTHDEDIAKFADRIIELSNGKVVKDYSICHNVNLLSNDVVENVDSDFNDCKADKIEKNTAETVGDECITLNNDIECKKTIKASKIDIKNFFSYKNAKSKQRKSTGLTAKSTALLSSTFCSNRLGKKITLMILSSVMLALIFLSSAVVFSSQESSFCHIMRANKVPFITMSVDTTYDLDVSDYNKISEYIEQKKGTNTAVVSDTYLHKNFNSIMPAEGTKAPVYAQKMQFSSTIYTDDPKDIGLKIINGRAPQINANGYDEIAISKTFYNYFKEVGKFENAEGEVVDFADCEILGSYIKEFRVLISGVFDDKNDYDMDTDIEEWDLNNYNSLSFNIIRPKAALVDSASLSAGEQYPCSVKLLNQNYMPSKRDGYYNFYPHNASLKKYYYDREELQTELAYDEIYVDYIFANNYRESTGKELSVGDTLQFDLVKLQKVSWYPVTEKRLQTELKFRVKGILNNFYAMVVNEQFFEKWVSPYFNGIDALAINSKAVTTNFIKDIKIFVQTNLPERLESRLDANDIEINLDMTKYENWIYDDETSGLVRYIIALPICLLSIIVFSILVSVLMSDMVKDRAKDILILRSLGGKNIDIWKIFGTVALVMLLVQFVAGCVLGALATYGLNCFWATIMSYKFYIPLFFVSGFSMLVLLASMLVISGIVLLFAMSKLNSESLRELFQKQKE